MKRFLIMILLFNGVLCFAGQANVDSLITLLPEENNKDKLKHLHTITRHYLFRSTDSCFKYGALAIELARKTEDARMVANLCKIMGYACYRVGDYDQCIQYYEKALENFLQEKKYLDATILINFLGDVHTKISDYSKAIDYFFAAEKSCDSLIKIDSLKASVKRLYGILYTNFGILYYQLDSLQKPLDYYSKALYYAEDLGDSTRMAASFSNIGMVYKKQQKLGLAKEKYLQALDITRKIGNRDYEISILNNIANIYKQTGKTDSSLVFYQTAKKVIFEVGDKHMLSVVNFNIAQTYYDLENYQMAEGLILAAMDLALQTGSQEVLYNIYNVSSKIYEKQGRNDLALEYHKKFADIKDSVTGQQTSEKIADIQIKYEAEKKEKENVLLRQDIEIKELSIAQKNRLLTIFIIVTFLVVTFLVIIYILFRQKSQAYDALVRQNLKSLEIEKMLEKNIVGTPDSVGSDVIDENNQFHDLKLRLEKFLVEEKPYLWADVNMEEFCKKLNTNRTYLSKLINDQYNHNFNDFLCEYRIREARNLLADSSNNNLSIEGIGETAGFKTNSHFHKKFKTQVGLTPKQFREKVLKRNPY